MGRACCDVTVTIYCVELIENVQLKEKTSFSLLSNLMDGAEMSRHYRVIDRWHGITIFSLIFFKLFLKHLIFFSNFLYASTKVIRDDFGSWVVVLETMLAPAPE